MDYFDWAAICLPVRLPFCPFVCLYVRLPFCLSVCLSVRLSVCMSVCLSAFLSICLPFCPFVCLYVRLPVCLSVCPSAFLSVCLSICLIYWFFYWLTDSLNAWLTKSLVASSEHVKLNIIFNIYVYISLRNIDGDYPLLSFLICIHCYSLISKLWFISFVFLYLPCRATLEMTYLKLSNHLFYDI